MADRKMKLVYFNGRGRAEVTRLLFKLAGRSFIDERIDFEELRELKPSFPKGKVPVLEVDGKVICESMAIARFVAREFNLYGSNNWESAVCDMVFDSTMQVFELVVTYQFSARTSREKAAVVTKLEVSFHELEMLVASLVKGDFVLGSAVSLADAALYVIMEFCERVIKDFDRQAYGAVARIVKNFSQIPVIASWLKTRPVSIH